MKLIADIVKDIREELAVWDWEHELMIDKTAKIRALLEMYKKT